MTNVNVSLSPVRLYDYTAAYFKGMNLARQQRRGRSWLPHFLLCKRCCCLGMSLWTGVKVIMIMMAVTAALPQPRTSTDGISLEQRHYQPNKSETVEVTEASHRTRERDRFGSKTISQKQKKKRQKRGRHAIGALVRVRTVLFDVTCTWYSTRYPF